MKNDVIMPTPEELEEMEREGHATQRKRGLGEMGTGVMILLIGIGLTIKSFNQIPDSYYDTQYVVYYKTILAGVILLGVGLSRQFKEKRRY